MSFRTEWKVSEVHRPPQRAYKRRHEHTALHKSDKDLKRDSNLKRIIWNLTDKMFLKLAIVSLVFVISVARANCAAITTVEIPTTPGVVIPYNPGTLPCKKNGSNLTEEQFDDMLSAFRDVSDASSTIRSKASLQYDTSVSISVCM